MLQALAVTSQKLGTKLVMIVTGFLLVALVAIGLTLLVSWDLEGGAAAVNQAGSERMRAYRIVMLLSQSELRDADRSAIREILLATNPAFGTEAERLSLPAL